MMAKTKSSSEPNCDNNSEFTPSTSFLPFGPFCDFFDESTNANSSLSITAKSNKSPFLVMYVLGKSSSVDLLSDSA